MAESGPSKQLVFASLNVRFREKQTLRLDLTLSEFESGQIGPSLASRMEKIGVTQWGCPNLNYEL